MKYGIAWNSVAWTVAALALGAVSSAQEVIMQDASPAVADAPVAMSRSALPTNQPPAVVDAPPAAVEAALRAPDAPAGRGSAEGAARQSSGCRRPPLVATAPPKLPKEFQILLTSSVFSRTIIPGQLGADGRPLKGAGGPNGDPNGGPNGPNAAPALAMPLRGVVLRDGTYIAIFEDPATHQHQDMREGDVVGGGKVTGITLHGFSFKMPDKVIQVAVGQNLRGEVVPPPAPPPPAPTPGKNGQPGGPNGGPQGPGGPPDAMQAAAMMEGGPPPQSRRRGSGQESTLKQADLPIFHFGVSRTGECRLAE